MAEEKTAAAQHSADYRTREKAKAERPGRRGRDSHDDGGTI